MTWFVPLQSLDASQFDAVHLHPSANRLILGDPLSGKTLVLFHRAIFLSRQFKIPLQSMRIWVASEAAQLLLQSYARLLGLGAECIQSYDLWCYQVYRSAIAAPLPVDQKNEIAWDLVRIAVRHAIYLGLIERPFFEAVLLDDAETYASEDFDLIRSMSNHLTVSARDPAFLDDWPNSPEGESHERPDIVLARNYRRNDALGPFLQQLGTTEGEELVSAFPEQSWESPYLFAASSPSEEFARLADEIRARMFYECVTVLVPNASAVNQIAVELITRNLSPDLYSAFETQSAFDPSRLTILTFGQALGITFETVVMPLLDPDTYAGYLPSDVRAEIISIGRRTTKWIYLSSSNSTFAASVYPSDRPQRETTGQFVQPESRATSALDDLL